MKTITISSWSEFVAQVEALHEEKFEMIREIVKLRRHRLILSVVLCVVLAISLIGCAPLTVQQQAEADYRKGVVTEAYLLCKEVWKDEGWMWYEVHRGIISTRRGPDVITMKRALSDNGCMSFILELGYDL